MIDGFAANSSYRLRFWGENKADYTKRSDAIETETTNP